MKKSSIQRATLAALLLLITTTLAFADIARPDSPKPKTQQNSKITTQMRIDPDEKTSEAKLIIPREIWQQMKAQLDGNGAQTASATTRFFNMTGAQTIMSGLFLSLAFAFGGVWLVRSRKGVERTARVAALSI